jgi:hypothetical protein
MNHMSEENIVCPGSLGRYFKLRSKRIIGVEVEYVNRADQCMLNAFIQT